MNILISWLGPLRAICMAIDGVLYSLLDNAYNLVINLASAKLLTHDTIKDMTANLYVLIGVVAFFRIAVILVNSIIDPEKLNEKGKGLSNIFLRVVGMLILLVVTPFLFQISYELQSKIVPQNDTNLVFKTILGNNANIGSSTNAGKALQNIALSSLITVNENYGKLTQLTCEDQGDGTCKNKGGYTATDTCDFQNCRNAIDAYNKMYVNEEMSPSKLASYVGVSKKIEVDGSKQEVYVYDYMMIVTGAIGIFMTYIIISFAIDIAVRMFELITLEILSPLFIATFVDPKSAQSGPFKNWLSAVGKSYASLYIRLAILALMILLISVINQSSIFRTMGNDVSGWAKIFMVIGLLIFAKKAPKWIGDMIGIKGEGGIGGLSIGKKLGGMALAGGLASKGLDKLKGQGKKTLNNTGKKAKNMLSRGFSGAVAANEARKVSKGLKRDGNLKDAKGNSISRKRYSQMARDAAIAKTKAEQLKNPENDFRLFKGVRDKYASIAANVNPNFESSKDKKIMAATEDAQAKLKVAGLDEISMGKKVKAAKDLALTKDLYGSKMSKVDEMTNPLNAEQMNNAYAKFFNGSIPTTEKEIQKAAYAASIGADSIDAQGNIMKDGKVLVSSKNVAGEVSNYVNEANPYLKQLWATTAYENNIATQNEFGSISENLAKSNQKLRETIIQRDQYIANNPAPQKPIEPNTSNLSDEVAKNVMEQYVNECTKYNTEYAKWKQDMVVFDNAVASATKDYNIYKNDKEKLVIEYKKAAGLDENGITVNEPGDNDGTIQVNGKYINKYGEYEVITSKDGNKQYKFVEKDMSDYFDLITQKMDNKLNGAKFKKKLDTIKEEYSIEGKKVENKN